MGRGVAVLCATHPELSPEDLDPQCISPTRFAPLLETRPSGPAAGPGTASPLSSTQSPLQPVQEGSLQSPPGMEGGPSNQHGAEERGPREVLAGQEGGLAGSRSPGEASVECSTAAGLAEHARTVRQHLEQWGPARDRFWGTLLVAAGLHVHESLCSPDADSGMNRADGSHDISTWAPHGPHVVQRQDAGHPAGSSYGAGELGPKASCKAVTNDDDDRGQGLRPPVCTTSLGAQRALATELA